MSKKSLVIDPNVFKEFTGPGKPRAVTTREGLVKALFDCPSNDYCLKAIPLVDIVTNTTYYLFVENGVLRVEDWATYSALL